MSAGRCVWRRSGGVILLLLGAGVTACRMEPVEPAPAPGEPVAILRVGFPAQPGEEPGPSDLAAALESAGPGTRVQLAAGVHVVDNPLVLRHPGLVVRGEGADGTVIRPSHSGRPVFRLEADGQGIQDLTIDALAEDGRGRATLAVHILDGRADCLVTGNTIIGTGASAIVGEENIHGCRVEDNFILDTGNDAIQVRGQRLRISRNVVVRYFDDGVDLHVSDDVVVADNCVSGGRIGLSMSAGSAVVSGNLVEDHALHGIGLNALDGRGAISRNRVLESGEHGIQMSGGFMVNGNEVISAGRAAFALYDMKQAVVQSNRAASSPVGFRLKRCSENLVQLNRCEPGVETPFREDDGSDRNLVRENGFGTEASVRSGSPERPTDGPTAAGACLRRLTPRARRLYDASRARRTSVPIPVETGSGETGEAVEKLARYLERNNPGFLTLRMDGATLRSEITEELLITLRGSGRHGIGLVRWPAMLLGRTLKADDASWELLREGRVAVIVRRQEAAPGVAMEFP